MGCIGEHCEIGTVSLHYVESLVVLEDGKCAGVGGGQGGSVGAGTCVELAKVGGALWFVTFLRSHFDVELGLCGVFFCGGSVTICPALLKFTGARWAVGEGCPGVAVVSHHYVDSIVVLEGSELVGGDGG